MAYFSAGVLDADRSMDKTTRANLAMQQQTDRPTDRGHKNEADVPEWMTFPISFGEPPGNAVAHRLDNGSIYYFDKAQLKAALESGISPEELILSRN